MMLSIKKLVPPYWRFKLHIEAQISSGVLMVGNQFTQVEFSYRDDVSVLLAVERRIILTW
jgi:hypothetical protein